MSMSSVAAAIPSAVEDRVELLPAAVAVIRVSKKGQRGGESYRTEVDQKEDVEALARDFGVRIVKFLYDVNYSGSTMDRPGLNEAMRMVQSREVQAILVAKVDRFARTVEGGLAGLRQIHEWGGRLLCGDHRADSRVDENWVTFTFLLTMAEAEWRRKRTQFARQKASATQRGVRVAAPPAGYTLTADRRVVVDSTLDEKGEPLVPKDAQRSHLIPELFARAAGGAGPTALRDWWFEQTGEWCRPHRFVGAVEKNGRSKGMIRNRFYLGELRDGETLSEVRHEALISEEQFEEAQAAPKPRKPRSQISKALLSGIAVCGGCGLPLTPSNAASSFAIYRCSSSNGGGRRKGVAKCQHRATVGRDLLDRYVEERYLAWAGEAETEDAETVKAALVAADAKLADVDRRIVEYQTTFASYPEDLRKAGADALLEERNRAAGERDDLEARHNVAASRHRAADAYHGWDVEKQRRYLMAGIEKVIVQPLSLLPAEPSPSGKYGRRRVRIEERVPLENIVWRRDD